MTKTKKYIIIGLIVLLIVAAIPTAMALTSSKKGLLTDRSKINLDEIVAKPMPELKNVKYKDLTSAEIDSYVEKALGIAANVFTDDEKKNIIKSLAFAEKLKDDPLAMPDEDE